MPHSPWAEHGVLFEDAGTFGGDVQVGRSYSRRFVRADMPGRLITVCAYPIEAQGPGDDEKSITLEMQTELMVCRDVDDPGSTEVWSDAEYSDLPERFDVVFTSVELAENMARALVRSMEPYHLGWDGNPGLTLD